MAAPLVALAELQWAELLQAWMPAYYEHYSGARIPLLGHTRDTERRNVQYIDIPFLHMLHMVFRLR